MGTAEVLTRIADTWARTRGWLEELVRIPSISFPGHDPAQVRRSAELTADILTRAGLEGVRLLELPDTHPYVYGEWCRRPGAPTVLMYAHHDVQPVGTPERWTSPPFEPTERDGRLYGRGTADDKAGIVAHAAAVAAWLETAGELPCNVKVIVEGEEEIGSPHLSGFLAAHRDTLAADVIVLADVTNWRVGWPALTYSLRGLAELFITVRALRQPVHSGMWGGPVPDALTGLLAALASLHDDHGRPAVPGLTDDVRPLSARERELLSRLEYTDADLRREAGLLDGVELIGDPDRSLLERLWFSPTINVIGIDCPSITQASNQLIAEARAKISLRLAPGQDPGRVQRLVADHLRAHVPWGLEVEITEGIAVPAWVTDPSGPAFDAALAALEEGYGHPAALIGCGGSIPFVQPFSDAFGGAPCLLVGVEDPHSNAHGEDESVHLEDLQRACRSEALLLLRLAEQLPTSASAPR